MRFRSLQALFRRLLPTAAIAFTALGAITVPVLAATGTASGPAAASPATTYGCIVTEANGHRYLEDTYTALGNYLAFLNANGGKCPSGGFEDTLAAPPATVSASQVTPVTATAQTDITKDQDSGAHGNWAVDTLVRQMTVTRHGSAAVSNCGGTAVNGITSCYYYTAAMTDTGSFTTIPGASSPNAGVPVSGTVTGSVSGGSAYEFYASGAVPNASLVPATLDASTGGTNSPVWPERFFPAGTSFGGVNEINWSYTYTAPTTCETWTDAFNNGGGTSSGAGDITGSIQGNCKS